MEQPELFVTDEEADFCLYTSQLEMLRRRELIDLPLYEEKMGRAIAEGMKLARKAKATAEGA